jgi:hypothetical protein
MRVLRIERDRVARPQFELLESDLDTEASAEDIRVFLAAVADQRILLARGRADVVDHVKELDLRIAGRREPFPTHAAGEMDRLAAAGALHRTWRRETARRPIRPRRGILIAEQIVDQEPEFVRHRIERAHRRHDMAVLDLRYEARRNADFARKPAHAHPCLLARAAQARSEPVGPVGASGTSKVCGSLARCSRHAT